MPAFVGFSQHVSSKDESFSFWTWSLKRNLSSQLTLTLTLNFSLPICFHSFGYGFGRMFLCLEFELDEISKPKNCKAFLFVFFFLFSKTDKFISFSYAWIIAQNKKTWILSVYEIWVKRIYARNWFITRRRRKWKRFCVYTIQVLRQTNL